jgi:Subunit ChlI of Mg-chelatase
MWAAGCGAVAVRTIQHGETRRHSYVLGPSTEVEVDIANGLVGMVLVGLPDTALREARDRIRSAIVFPVKLTC